MGNLYKELNVANKMISKMDEQNDETAWSWEVSCINYK